MSLTSHIIHDLTINAVFFWSATCCDVWRIGLAYVHLWYLYINLFHP